MNVIFKRLNTEARWAGWSSAQVFNGLLPIFFVAFSCVGAMTQAADWKAGVSRKIITPKQPMWMSGYASRSKPAEGTLHDLWAKTLVVSDADDQKHVFVSLDLVGIGRDVSSQLCSLLMQQHELERSQISIFTSHTHTGPVVGHNLGSMYFLDSHQQKLIDDYRQFLVETVASSVREAFDDLESAEISYALGNASFAVNRRNNREADVPKLRNAGELKGPIDHSVPVVAVHNTEGDLKTVLFGYACHATVLSFYQWSGDWPGFAQLEIEKRYPETVAMFMAGCGADQNPLPRRTVDLAEGYGKRMAEAVGSVLESEMQSVSGSLTSSYEEIPLALDDLPAKEAVEKDTGSSNKYIAARAKNLLSKFETDGKLDQTYPYPVQVVGMGSKARLVILGGEVVVDYSIRLRQELSDLDLWVAGYSNDVMAYIPSKRVLKEGGYEGETSMIYYGLPTVWSEQVEEHIVSTVHSLVKKLERR